MANFEAGAPRAFDFTSRLSGDSNSSFSFSSFSSRSFRPTLSGLSGSSLDTGLSSGNKNGLEGRNLLGAGFMEAMPGDWNYVHPSERARRDRDSRRSSSLSITPLKELGESADSLFIPPLESSSISIGLNSADAIANRDTDRKESERKANPEKFDLPDTRIVDSSKSTILDTNKSIAQLIEEGTLKAAKPTESNGDRIETAIKTEGEKLEAGITVRFADATAESRQKPDFIIKADGSTEVLSNPETTGNKSIVIELERPAGDQAQATTAQQEKLDQLVAYLSERLPQTNESLKKLDINDSQGLVSQELKAALSKDSFENIPAETRRQVERLNRLPSRGSMPSRDAGDYFPQRDVPRQRGETDQLAATKEAIAAVFNPDAERPYETVREARGERSARVGRYGFSYRLFLSWLSDVYGELDPNDPEAMKKAMTKLAAQGKIPAGFAAKFENPQFAKNFSRFLNNLKTGQEPISAKDMAEFFPKELQETMATDLVKSFRESTENDMGKVALGFHLGKTPAELTQEDLSNPANQAIAKAAREFFSLAESRQRTQPSDRIHWERTPDSELQFRLLDVAKANVGRSLWAETEHRNSVKNGRLGCAATTTRLLELAGNRDANSAGVGVFTDQLIRNGWQRVPINQAAPGDIVYGGRGSNWKAGGGNAHIGVMGENGMVYHNSSSRGVLVEDKVFDIFSSRRFGQQRWALRPPGASV